MIAYDFPNRLRTPGSARRELRNLKRSLETAQARRDASATDYLTHRRQRARTAAQHLFGNHIHEDTE